MRTEETTEYGIQEYCKNLLLWRIFGSVSQISQKISVLENTPLHIIYVTRRLNVIFEFRWADGQ